MNIKTNFAIALILMIIFAGVDVGLEPDAEAKVAKPPEVKTEEVKQEEIKPKAETAQKTEGENEIENYVREVFGNYSDEALLLLKGNEKCKGENPSLNPLAINDNYLWGGKGRDCGIFQINDYFHPYTCEQMKNYKLNIDYAWRMFKNDGYSFKRWTAGRCLGI